MANENTVQNIILENKEKLSISGVKDILTFDEEEIIIDTTLGILQIRGSNLKVEKLSVDSGEINANGIIDEMIYQKDQRKEKSVNILKSIFR